MGILELNWTVTYHCKIELIYILTYNTKFLNLFSFSSPPTNTSSDQLKRSHSWDHLTPSEKEERIRMKLEQVRITEKERRKAVLAARKRQREALKPKV